MDNFEPSLPGLSQRLPPNNIAAEMALLGALLANNKAYERVGEFLQAEHFADPVNGRIFAAIARRVDAGQLADAVTLKAEFEHSGVLDEVGGTPYLAQLLTAMVGIINAGEYGRTIHDAWLRRQMIDIGETVGQPRLRHGRRTRRGRNRSKPPNRRCSTWRRAAIATAGSSSLKKH